MAMTPREELIALRRLKELEAKSGIVSNQDLPKENKNEPLLKNAMLGFAARGNQAFGALNPWADKEKIASEQEWVKQNKGADIGQMLADIAITAPAGGLPGAVARSIGTGLLELGTHDGNVSDKLSNLAYGTLGAGLGEGAASALGFLAKPFKESTSRAQTYLKDKAGELGIKLNAAQQTGNKSLQYLDSALDFLPSSSTAQKEFKDSQRQAWQKSLFEQGSEHADTAGQLEMGNMKRRIGDVYKDVSSRNNINVDQELNDALSAVASERNLSRMDVNKRPIVESYLKEFNGAPVGSTFSGEGYQATRSMLDKQYRALKNSNPHEANALKDIRTALDESMTRSVSPEDALAWSGANKDYAVMKSIEKAVNPTTEEISPNLLMNYLKQRDPNRVVYGKGDQALTDIAKVGKEFIPSKVADSGTAQRAQAMKFLSGASAGKLAGAMYAGDLAMDGDPVGAVTPAIATGLAAILFPKAAGSMMRKQGGYLSKGAVDMSKETISGLSRQRLLSELLRHGSSQTLNDMRNK